MGICDKGDRFDGELRNGSILSYKRHTHFSILKREHQQIQKKYKIQTGIMLKQREIIPQPILPISINW